MSTLSDTVAVVAPPSNSFWLVSVIWPVSEWLEST